MQLTFYLALIVYLCILKQTNFMTKQFSVMLLIALILSTTSFAGRKGTHYTNTSGGHTYQHHHTKNSPHRGSHGGHYN